MKKDEKAEGFMNGLANVIEKLGDLAEKGEKLKRTVGEVETKTADGRTVRGHYGVNVKVGLGESQRESATPMRSTKPTAPVHETREPLTDVFTEDTQILVVAEMPGISAADVRVDIQGDLMHLQAQHSSKRYAKDVLLPTACGGSPQIQCNNGIVEIRCQKV